MTKGEHTYVRTGQALYPLHNFFCEGITILSFSRLIKYKQYNYTDINFHRAI